MALGLGHESFVGIGEEVEYGTPVDRTKFLKLIRGGDRMRYNQDLVEPPEISSVSQSVAGVIVGPKRAGGTITTLVDCEGYDLIFKHLLGTRGTPTQPDATNAPTVYQTIYSLADALPIGLTVEVYRGGVDSNSWLYHGCKISAARFACAVNGWLLATLTFIGEDSTRAGKSTPSYSSKQPMYFTYGALSWNNGTPVVVARNVEIDLNNALQLRPTIGSQVTLEPCRGGKRVLSGSFTAEFDSTTLWDDFLAAETRALTITYTGPVIATTYYQKILFTVTISKLTTGEAVVDDEGIVLVPCTFKGYLSGSTKELTVTLTNTITV